ncbi:MAG: hypothetical protein A2X46_06600 [Lentisphaerae bacterium GWF2_57_35]|nr:MAG: hypothetical protein A2X46_06600 [Lentisphaerae bacterium GWF2_57_35]
MNYEIDTPLTMTGLIATIVSLIFAGAAWYNSYRRRHHAQPDVPRGPVSPPPAEVARLHKEPSIQPAKPAFSAPVPSPFEASDALPNSSSLFKKLGVNGMEEPSQVGEDKQYRWE